MPIYEYLCEACGRMTELMQKVGDPPPARCAECGGRRMAKLVSRTAFQLKGGGWYADLYSSPRKKEAAGESEGTATGAEAAKDKGKEEPKPAAKPEPKPEVEKGPKSSRRPRKKGGK